MGIDAIRKTALEEGWGKVFAPAKFGFEDEELGQFNRLLVLASKWISEMEERSEIACCGAVALAWERVFPGGKKPDRVMAEHLVRWMEATEQAERQIRDGQGR
jgi:hypothetical protein